jgi:hypothetical protein
MNRDQLKTGFVWLTLIVTALIARSTPVYGEDDCIRHECSNDYVSAEQEFQTGPVLGDEMLMWDAVPSWRDRDCVSDGSRPCTTDLNRRCYEVALYPEMLVIHRSCEETVFNQRFQVWVYYPPSVGYCPYAVKETDHPVYGLTYGYVVRNCEGPVCSDWAPKTADGEQDFVEIIGGEYACFGVSNGARCEERCYPGAQKIYPGIPDCPLPD